MSVTKRQRSYRARQQQAYDRVEWRSTNNLKSFEQKAQCPALEGKYDFTLPSIDFDIELTDDIVPQPLRARRLRELATDFDWNLESAHDYRVDQGIPGEAIASVGNPGLLPHEADNLDLSSSTTTAMLATSLQGTRQESPKLDCRRNTRKRDPQRPASEPRLGPLTRKQRRHCRLKMARIQVMLIREYIFANFADQPGVDGNPSHHRYCWPR